VIYFAYGSNIDQKQMGSRCPGAQLTGIAQLAGYRLCFPRRSSVRDSAILSIEPFEGTTVWGVTYEMSSDDLRRLDHREGYDAGRPPVQNSATRIPVKVSRLRGETVEAYTYVVAPQPKPGLPSTNYLKLIINAAAVHGFPEDYLSALRAVPATP